MGGDEFVLVAEGLPDERAAVALGNRVTQAGREPYRVGEEEFVCTVSVGIATTADASHGPNACCRRPTLRCTGRRIGAGTERRSSTRNCGRQRSGGLGPSGCCAGRSPSSACACSYQPIFDLQSGHLVRAEALVRIFDPDWALLEPAAFLEVAEETGLLTTIDAWVLGQAVRQGAAWHARFGANGSQAWE